MLLYISANFCPVEQGVHGAVRHLPDRRVVLPDFRLWRAAGVEQPQEGAQGGSRGAAGDAAGAQQALKGATELKKSHKPHMVCFLSLHSTITI
jgi:hypothetical protein